MRFSAALRALCFALPLFAAGAVTSCAPGPLPPAPSPPNAPGSSPVGGAGPGTGGSELLAGGPAASDAGSVETVSSILSSRKDEGLTWEDLQVGLGASVQLGDAAKVHYIGRLEDGTEFDASRNRAGSFDLVLGKGMVIKGFERGMVGMRTGGVRRVRIPWQLGYGEQGNPPRIPPRANLVFDIELLDIPVPAAKVPPKAAPPGQPPH